MQIYNEAVDDLLAPDNCNLRLVQSGKRDVVAENATWRRCESCHELLKARELGSKQYAGTTCHRLDRCA